MSKKIASLDVMRFRGLWILGKASLWLADRRGQVHVLPPTGHAAAKHLTLIARIPAVAGTGIGRIMSELQSRYPSHHYYPPDTVHVTIKNLDDAAQGMRDQSFLVDSIRKIVGSCGPFVLKARGLGISPGSVFLQLFPEDQTLARLRHRLSGVKQEESRRYGSSAAASERLRDRLFRNAAFANLIRFSGPVTPAFLAEIARYRAHDFGPMAINACELVRTDKFLSRAGTEVIAQVSIEKTQPCQS